MAERETCTWVGGSRTKYTYYVYPLPASFNANQFGNYIFTKRNAQNLWVPIYIGQGELCDRCGEQHHKWQCVRSKGATHFHCHLNASEADRRAEEADLLEQYTNAYAPQGCNETVGG